MQLPLVSIVVPVYQGEGIIEHCIESLLSQDYPKEKLEIILVDNNSTDATAQIIKKYPVKYVFEEKQGVCFARNKGLQEATGELLAYTDADCIAEKDWISKLVLNFEDEKVGGVGGHLAPLPSDNVVERYIAYRHILSQEGMFSEKKYSPPFFITANVMYRTAVLKQLGGFDNYFSVAGEDADLAWRVAEVGYTLKLAPKAIVYHKHRSSVKKLFWQMFNYGIGTVTLFKKYRHNYGKKYWIHAFAYKNMFKGFYHAPYALLFNKDPYRKYIPLLDGINNLGFVLGKIYGSIKYRALVL